ncbi:glycolate oxidase subunit GlcF [Microbacteriaceae bacterium K1510]|nr:glycolate oxidase subunit GlcF [Microbacteriaceae bacterium K1510]
MRTTFTAAQLADPAIAEADQILQTCVHYGFCTNACPTYVLTRDENDSPRGRIDLIRAMLETGGAPTPKTVHHLDRCLSCLSCMTTCAVKVDYVHLIDRARTYIEQHYRRPIADRFMRALLAYVLPRPRLFETTMRAGRLAQPFASALPSRLRAMLSMIPAHASPDILAPQIFPAEGTRRKRVALLAGCAQQALNGNINAATIRLLQRHGCEVVIAQGTGCCGSLPLHMGREDEAKGFAQANVEAWSREPFDAFIVNASGCGTTMKDYGHLLHNDDAKRVGALTRDVTELLHDIGLNTPPNPCAYRVAYHDPCSMQHGQKVIEQPRALLRAAGFQVVDVPEKHFCCGSAGTYNLLQPEMAQALGQRKAAHIESTTPDIVATGNIGCMTQLACYLGKPIVHTAELLDWATGGPLPPALEGVPLPEPQAIQTQTAPAADAGFW